MRRFPGLVIALLCLFAVPLSQALSPEPRLLSLVPPGAKIVAGIESHPPKDRAGSFVLITRNNTLDLEDFYALTGVDSTRNVHKAIFVALGDNTGHLSEHSLLMMGHFDQPRIYKSAVDGGARAFEYSGVDVVEIQPFLRERGEMNDVRWLAIVDSNVLLFGTIASVQQELGRHLANSPADPFLVRELAHMHSDDETWCVLSAPNRNDEIRNALVTLDPKLAELAREADIFQFGIRYRKQVEFEYKVTTTSATPTISNSIALSLTGSLMGSSWLSSPDTSGGDRTERGVVIIPSLRFAAWLAKVNDHAHGGSRASR